MFSQGRPKKKRVGPEPDAKAIYFLLLAAAAGAAALWRPPEEGMLSQENSFQPSLMNTAKAANELRLASQLPAFAHGYREGCPP